MLRVNARWGSKQTSEGRGGTEATRGAPGLDGVTPVKAQNVKRGTECLGKQEFLLPSSYRRMEGDETNLDGKDHKAWDVWVMPRVQTWSPGPRALSRDDLYSLQDQVYFRRPDLLRSVDIEKEDPTVEEKGVLQ